MPSDQSLQNFSPDQAQEIIRQIDKTNAAESLEAFTRIMWPVIEPATPFIRGWAYDAMCEHLAAISSGLIKRLLINIPPGSAKSSAVLIFFPAWEWGPLNRPYLRYLTTSYSSSLTERHNARFGKIVSSDLYRSMWGDKFEITRIGDVRVENDKTGWVLASSVGGVGTGARGDRVLIDDPNNVKDSESSTVREGTNLWFREVMPDRLNDQDESAIVVIQQRTNESDVSGTILEHEMGYTHLCIPNEYEADRHCSIMVTGWEDPRGCETDDDGDLLEDENGRLFRLPELTTDEDPRPAKSTRDGTLYWPARLSAKATLALKRDKGEWAYASQYQQRPAPRGGGIIKREWWQMLDSPIFPRMSFTVASLDTAQSAREENDYNALTIWGVFPHQGRTCAMLMMAWQCRIPLHLEPATREELRQFGLDRNVTAIKRAEALEEMGRIGLVEKVATYCDSYNVDTLLIENKANGHAANEMLESLFQKRKWNVILQDPSGQGDKVSRAQSTVPLFSRKMVWAPAAFENGLHTGLFRAWAALAITQLALLPRGKHDDVADSATQALRWLRANGMLQMPEEIRQDEEEERARPLNTKPLYPGSRA